MRADFSQFRAAEWFVSGSLLTDREETFRCLVAHPWYQGMEKAVQLRIKQELVFFFDRRFTYQMGQLFKIDLSIHGTLLRLGCNSTFREEDSIDCGGVDETSIAEDNTELWAGMKIEFIQRTEGAMGVKLSDPVPPKRNERVSETQESEYNVNLQRALTPKLTTHRANRVTQSEKSEYTRLTKKTLGPEVLAEVTECTVSEGPRIPGYEADTSDTEVDAYGQSNGGSSPMDSEVMNTSRMEDVSLE
jgi:hypothetical protein